MPLVRYEVRCEHSLANPELYRTAGQDDSEGLLEGVAMAGLVGLVRQLGDLAEFAAEIFHDLHDDIIAMVSRGRNLKARVTRLEGDLPAVEKALIAECNQFQFACSARTKWRAPLPMDQNLCAQGELPRFVRNFYDDCRGPPRLFLLDKFDEAGRGACVKRYTDPTFFRISWAASLVMKAEQQRRDREAELLRKTTAAADYAGPKIFPRERLSSALFENLEGFTGDFTPELRSRRLDHVFEIPTEGVLTPDGPRSPEEPRSPVQRKLPQVAQGPVLAPLKISSKDSETAKRRVVNSIEDVLSDDESSDAEFYVDALTTMGSDDLDSEPGSRSRWEVDSNQSRFGLESEDDESLNHSVLKAHVERHWKTPPRMDDEVEQDEDEEFVQRLDLVEVGTGFDTVCKWEDSGGQSDEASRSVEESIELASVASVNEDDSGNCLAIVAVSVFQEEALPSDELHDMSPDELRDMRLDKLPDTSPDELPDTSPDELPDMSPDKLPDKPPDYLSDTLSDKFPYSLPEEPPHNLSIELPDRLPKTQIYSLPSSPPDRLPNTLIDSLPSSPPNRLPKTQIYSLPSSPPDRLPNTLIDSLPSSPPNRLPKTQIYSLPSSPPDSLPNTLIDSLPSSPPNRLPKTQIYSLPSSPPERLPKTLVDSLPSSPPDRLPNTLIDSLPSSPPNRLPNTLIDSLPSSPPNRLPNTLIESLPSSPPNGLPNTLIDSLPSSPPKRLSNTLIDSLPSSPPDRLSTPPLDEVPASFSDKLPYQSPDDKLPSVPPSTPPAVLPDKVPDTISDKVPNKLPDSKIPRLSPPKLPRGRSDKSPDIKLSDKSPTKPPGSKLPLPPTKRLHGRSDKLPDKLPDKPPTKPSPKSSPEKPSYQSHDSVSLLDSFRPSVRVKPIVASIEARAQAVAVETTTKPQLNLTDEPPLKNSSSPVTTPTKGRRLWTKEDATQIHTSILQLADMDQREGTNGAHSEGNSPEVDASNSTPNFQERGSLYHSHVPDVSHVSHVSDEEGYTSSANSSPKGLPNFCALLSPSESPPRVAEGLMGPPSHFVDRRSPRPPPVTPFLADSPSVSRSPSLNIKLAVPGAVAVRSFLPPQASPGGSDADKLKNVPATSPRKAGENGALQPEPSRIPFPSLPNPVPRPRTWVDRSESNVAATLRAIRQAAAVASDDDTGSECRSDC